MYERLPMSDRPFDPSLLRQRAVLQPTNKSPTAQSLNFIHKYIMPKNEAGFQFESLKGFGLTMRGAFMATFSRVKSPSIISWDTHVMGERTGGAQSQTRDPEAKPTPREAAGQETKPVTPKRNKKTGKPYRSTILIVHVSKMSQGTQPSLETTPKDQ